MSILPIVTTASAQKQEKWLVSLQRFTQVGVKERITRVFIHANKTVVIDTEKSKGIEVSVEWLNWPALSDPDKIKHYFKCCVFLQITQLSDGTLKITPQLGLDGGGIAESAQFCSQFDSVTQQKLSKLSKQEFALFRFYFTTAKALEGPKPEVFSKYFSLRGEIRSFDPQSWFRKMIPDRDNPGVWTIRDYALYYAMIDKNVTGIKTLIHCGAVLRPQFLYQLCIKEINSFLGGFSNFLDILKLLVKEGGETINQACEKNIKADKTSLSPLMALVKDYISATPKSYQIEHFQKVLRVLLEGGANPNFVEINDGPWLLDHLLKHAKDQEEFDLQNADIILMFLEKGALSHNSSLANAFFILSKLVKGEFDKSENLSGGIEKWIIIIDGLIKNIRNSQPAKETQEIVDVILGLPAESTLFPSFAEKVLPLCKQTFLALLQIDAAAVRSQLLYQAYLKHFRSENSTLVGVHLFEFLIEKTNDINATCDGSSLTPLKAIIKDYIAKGLQRSQKQDFQKIITSLLNAKANPNFVEKNNDPTMLASLIEHSTKYDRFDQNADIIELFLDHGALPSYRALSSAFLILGNILTRRASDSVDTSVLIKVTKKWDNIIKILISNFKKNNYYYDSTKTGLSQREEVVTSALKLPDLSSHSPSFAATALREYLVALKEANFSVVSESCIQTVISNLPKVILLESLGADVNVALVKAVNKCVSIEIINKLLETGADPLKGLPDALRIGDIEIIRALGKKALEKKSFIDPYSFMEPLTKWQRADTKLEVLKLVLDLGVHPDTVCGGLTLLGKICNDCISMDPIPRVELEVIVTLLKANADPGLIPSEIYRMLPLKLQLLVIRAMSERTPSRKAVPPLAQEIIKKLPGESYNRVSSAGKIAELKETIEWLLLNSSIVLILKGNKELRKEFLDLFVNKLGSFLKHNLYFDLETKILNIEEIKSAMQKEIDEWKLRDQEAIQTQKQLEEEKKLRTEEKKQKAIKQEEEKKKNEQELAALKAKLIEQQEFANRQEQERKKEEQRRKVVEKEQLALQEQYRKNQQEMFLQQQERDEAQIEELKRLEKLAKEAQATAAEATKAAKDAAWEAKSLQWPYRL